ncbi:MAG: AAA family ATPase [Clostridia bacterium]|nr:AAA family ATPase [Clostridia bacterium]
MGNYENNTGRSLGDVYSPNVDYNNTMYKPLVAESYTDMEESEGQAYVFSLSRFVSKCLKRLWILVVMVVVLALAGALYGNLSYKPQYVAQSTFVVNVFRKYVVETEDGKTVLKTSLDLSTANSVLENLKVLILSDQIIEKALDVDPTINLSIEDVKAITTINTIPSTSIMSFTVRYPDPNVAYSVVNAITEVAPIALKDMVSNGELALIDDANVPTVPTSSNPAKTYAFIGAAAAAIIFFGVIFLLDFMSSTIKDAKDAEVSIGKRLLGVIPDNRKFRKNISTNLETGRLITDHSAGFSYIEAFKSMRIKVENLCARHKYKSILVTSTDEHEGKTTIAINLAISLANKKYKVLLVECDLRRPNLFYMMQLSGLEYGVLDVLDGAVPYKEAITHIPDYGVYGILSRRSVNDATERLGSDAMRDLIFSLEASKEFDFVIYDAPPALLMTDAEILTRYVDSVIMVVKEDTAQLHDIKNTIAKLSNEKAVVLGTVLNGAKKAEKKNIKRT